LSGIFTIHFDRKAAAPPDVSKSHSGGDRPLPTVGYPHLIDGSTIFFMQISFAET